jgi:hypothetical protein
MGDKHNGTEKPHWQEIQSYEKIAQYVSSRNKNIQKQEKSKEDV